MARKSLRPHSNQIRAWVRQGRTDAWIAHQLEVTVQDIEQFKRSNELDEDEAPERTPSPGYDEEIDLRAEDDALIAAELEAATEAARLAREQAEENGDRTEAGDDEQAPARSRRRGRRGGRGRRSAPRAPATLEATFDHGEEGYGLWLDPSVQDNAIYAEHWAGYRPVLVTIEEEQIVIRRAGEDS